MLLTNDDKEKLKAIGFVEKPAGWWTHKSDRGMLEYSPIGVLSIWSGAVPTTPFEVPVLCSTHLLTTVQQLLIEAEDEEGVA